MDFNIFSVYLSDLDEGAVERYFLGFQRTLPDLDPDEEDGHPEEEGFYVEFNGQENGCYQRATAQAKITLIELSDIILRVLFTPAADFHQGMIDATGDVPLSSLTIDLDLRAEQRTALREALQTVVGQDCEFRYPGGA